MPRGTGAKVRRSAQRAADGAGVEGASRALDPAPSAVTAALATDEHLDDLIATLAPKVGTCTNCTHMAAKHTGAGGACAMPGCACSAFEAEASESAFDAVEYFGEPGALEVVGFEPSDDRFEAAIAELTHRSPAAEPLVRLCLEQLRLRRFVDSPAPPVTPPLDGGGDLFTLEWEAILVPEGKLTEDGRAFAPGSVRWRELPLSLAAMLNTADGHDGARVCGRIDRIWRDETAGLIRAAGVFDDSTFGREIARMVADGVLRGNSVDVAPLDVEVGPASRWFDPEGNWAPNEEVAASDLEDVLFVDDLSELPIVVIKDAVIGMSTVCPFPAFAEARIEVGASLVAAANPLVWTLTLDAGYHVTRGNARSVKGPVGATGAPGLTASAALAASDALIESVLGDDAALGVIAGILDPAAMRAYADGGMEAVRALAASAASAAPAVAPPSEWFADPELAHLTPLVVTDDGRVYGHAAGWDSCHTGFPDVCVTPPASNTDYGFFHLKSVVCADGSDVAVGTITLEAPHANQSLGLVDATSHYDNTGTAAADVAVGEDEHGIWVAGALRPGMSPQAIRELRGAALSGDWRNYEGNLELVALLAVNVPGFPVPRPSARVASGVMQTLIAAGAAEVAQMGRPGVEGGFAVMGPPGGDFPPAVDAATAAKLVALASPALALVAE